MRRVFTSRPVLAVLAIYAASRVLSTAILGALFAVATANGWHFASYRSDPTFFTFSGSWDASFYKTIAEHGYPTSLPVDADGHVTPNPWAFLPVFPGIVRAVMAVSGLGFYPAGVAVATLFGAGAAVMLYLVVAPRVGTSRALVAVALFCVGPMGFLLQAAYAESAFLFFLFAALWCLLTRRYLLLIPFAVVAAFTRPGVLALALTLGIHLVLRWRASRPGASRPERLPARDTVRIVAAGLITAGAGLAWSPIATAVTGHPSAYLATELSWWTGYVGRVSFVPLTPWFTMATTHLGWAGIVVVLLAPAAAAFWLTRRGAQELGPDLRAFLASYGLYLFAVFLPQQSLFRLLMPAAPVLATRTFTATRHRATLTLVAAALLQCVAVFPLWFLGYP